MGERAVPIKYLNDESKDKAGKMEDLHDLIPNSPKGTEKEKDDPEKMDQDHTIRKNLVEHVPLSFPQTICWAGDSSCQPSPLGREARGEGVPNFQGSRRCHSGCRDGLGVPFSS